MQLRHTFLAPAHGLLLLAATGCYWHAPYGTHGYPGAGGGYPTPPVSPRFQGGPHLGPPSSQPGLQNSNPQSAPSGQPQQWQGSPGSQAPGRQSAQGRRPTPARDPNDSGADQADQPGLPPSDPEYLRGSESGREEPSFDSLEPPSGYNESQGSTKRPYEDLEDTAFRGAAPEPTETNQGWVPDGASLQATAQTQVVSAKSETADDSGPDPYAYDAENYRWLRGVVDYRSEDGSWNIIYDLQPPADDPYGGSLRLIDDGKLDGLKSGDVVLVQGHVDPESPDPRGKPQYRVQHLARLMPEQ